MKPSVHSSAYLSSVRGRCLSLYYGRGFIDDDALGSKSTFVWFEWIVVSFATYYVLVMRFSDVYVMLSSQLLLVVFYLAYDRVSNGCSMTNRSHIIGH